MATIYIERDHQLDERQLRELGELLASKLTDKLGGSSSWSGHELHYTQSGASACAVLGQNKVEVTVELGFLMSGFSGMIKTEIERVLDKSLEP